jgi:tol-pal system protein YbgF
VRLVASFAALAVSGLVAQPGLAQSRGERIETLESRMDAVERQLANQALLEMSRQLEVLGGELRGLRGQVDELRHELERARAQQRDQYVDLDTRLRAAEAALTAAQAGLPAGGPQAEYQAAFDLLKDGKYEEAATALAEFVARHPEHELAPNALYWLGEAHYVQRDYPAALAAFESLVRDYPGARKVPDALLKAGYSQQEMKRLGPARALLTRVVEEYPDTQAAAEARVRLERFPPGGG